MSARRSPIPPESAWEALERAIRPLGEVVVKRREALGRVLAEPLFATVDVPPADVSAMDGYALAGAASEAEVRPVSGVIAAGDSPGFALEPGGAVAIMTGAPVPARADRVIPIELTDGGDRTVRIDRPVEAGANIRRRAEVLSTGDEILPAGSRLTPGALALVATHGLSSVPVAAQPTVSVLTTGDEVVPPEVTPRPGELRDSHTDFLLSAGRTLGLDFVSLGIAPDERQALAELVQAGLTSDVLLIGGGVSMGEFDFVEDVLANLGCELLFDRVAIQPGKPLTAARHEAGLVIGLPGNPASVMACFWLFVRPLLRRLQGIEDGFCHGVLAGVLQEDLPAGKARDRFVPAEVSFVKGTPFARPLAPRGSHDLWAYGRGSGLLRIRADSPPVAAGGACEILPLVDWPSDPSRS